MTSTAQVADHRALSSSADPERPLPAYGGLVVLFCGACAIFAAFIQRSGRQVPERIDPGDLALVAFATHKAARLLAKDRVTGVLRAPFTEYEGSSGPGEVANARADTASGARLANSCSARTASGCGSRAAPPPA